MKKFISGFVLGALLFALPVFAQNSRMLEAFYNGIKLKVYGQFVDTEGNEPFIVGGRTYVPARYVAEAMGGVVKWNETENTVEVTKPTPAATPEPFKMTSDGIEASYYSDLGGYYLDAVKIKEKYPRARLMVPNGYTPMIFWYEPYSENRITLDVAYKNGVVVNYDDYETKILPLFKDAK